MPWPLLRRAPARDGELSCVRQLFPAKTSSRSLRILTLRECLFAIALGSSVASIQAQSGPRQSGEYDKEVVVPTVVGTVGQRDGAALNELIAHLKVVGASPWIGMQGTGLITYGAEDATAYNATLSILGVTGFRLDGRTATGDMSIRIYGRQGTIQEADGHKYPLPLNTATSGIVQFPQLRRGDFPAGSERVVAYFGSAGFSTLEGADGRNV